MQTIQIHNTYKTEPFKRFIQKTQTTHFRCVLSKMQSEAVLQYKKFFFSNQTKKINMIDDARDKIIFFFSMYIIIISNLWRSLFDNIIETRSRIAFSFYPFHLYIYSTAERLWFNVWQRNRSKWLYKKIQTWCTVLNF